MKIIPQYSLENAKYFVDSKFNHAENEEVTRGRKVFSAPLVFGKRIPLLSLAKTGELIEENVIDSNWTIDPEHLRLQSVVIEFPGLPKLIGSNIGLNVEDARFRPSLQNAPQTLVIVKKKIPIVVGLPELACWSSYEERAAHAPLLQYVAEHDLHLIFSLEVSASTKWILGDCCILLHSFNLDSILDHAGNKLEIACNEELKAIAEYVKDAQPRGYWLDAQWLDTKPVEQYPFEMSDPCPIGKGTALLVRAAMLAEPDAIGFAADVSEQSTDHFGTTTLYLQPGQGEPEWKVVIEEGFDLPEGASNIEFWTYTSEWKDPDGPGNEIRHKWVSLGRFEHVLPGLAGFWVPAIVEYLLSGDEYRVTLSLPDSCPKASTYEQQYGVGENPT